MAGTRDSAGREVMGWIRGGYQRWSDALGGRDPQPRRPRCSTEHPGPRRSCPTARRDPAWCRTAASRRTTWSSPRCCARSCGRLLSAELSSRARPPTPAATSAWCAWSSRARRSVSPYYTLNITDRSCPLTTVVETTHVIDPEPVGGHLLYVPKYVRPGLEGAASGPRPRSSASTSPRCAACSPPSTPTRDVLATQVARARYAEPVHLVGVASRVPDVPGPRPWPRRPRTCTRRSSTARRSLGVAERVAAGLLERVAERRRAGGDMKPARPTCDVRPAPRGADGAHAHRRDSRSVPSCSPRGRGGRCRARAGVLLACGADVGHLGRPRRGHGLRPAWPAPRPPTARLPYVDYVYYYGPLGAAPAGGRVRRCSATSIGPRPRSASCSRRRSSPARTCWRASSPGRLGGASGDRARRHGRRSRARTTASSCRTRSSAPLAVLLCLGALLLAQAVARGRGPRLAARRGHAAGLATLTRPEFALAVFAALRVWLGAPRARRAATAARRRARRCSWRCPPLAVPSCSPTASC